MTDARAAAPKPLPVSSVCFFSSQAPGPRGVDARARISARVPGVRVRASAPRDERRGLAGRRARGDPGEGGDQAPLAEAAHGAERAEPPVPAAGAPTRGVARAGRLAAPRVHDGLAAAAPDRAQRRRVFPAAPRQLQRVHARDGCGDPQGAGAQRQDADAPVPGGVRAAHHRARALRRHGVPQPRGAGPHRVRVGGHAGGAAALGRGLAENARARAHGHRRARRPDAAGDV